MKAIEFLTFLTENEIDFINFRFTDMLGEQKQITRKTTSITKKILEHGVTIDGSSIKGWKTIDNSDILLKPDLNAYHLETYSAYSAVNLICDVIDTNNGTPYICDPRSIAKKSEQYLTKLGIAEKAFFGPELEFFVFDNIAYSTEMLHSFYQINSEEAFETSKNIGGYGYKAQRKGSYDSISPIDTLYDLRSEILMNLDKVKDMQSTIHHHEVGNGQCEIGFQYGALTEAADKVQVAKHIIKNTMFAYGKTGTFMPKPFKDDAGSGMHCHISLSDNGINLFHGNSYHNLADIALYFIGGVAKHISALCAFTNPTVNSYKRLRPGFEAPVIMSYSAKNRSTAVRIPYSDVNSKNETRFECRFPDPSANSYLAFAAILMAGIDGIINKIHPGDANDLDLFKIDASTIKNYKLLPTSLPMALDALEQDNEFLTRDNVFAPQMLESYIKIKREEFYKINAHIGAAEFSEYYAC